MPAISLRLPLLAALAGLATLASATGAPSMPASTVHPAAVVADHRSQQAVAALHLSDPALAARVLDVVATHAVAVRRWHEEHGAEAKRLWAAWAKARNTHDPALVAAALGRVDALYATFLAEHDRFLAGLHAWLSPAQIAVVEDRVIDKGHKEGRVELTFRVYQEEFPSLTAAQKAVLLAKLEAARTEAVDAETSSEKAAMFKRHKDRIEAYLAGQGYDVKQMIRAFGQKLKERAAERKAERQHS